MSTSKLNLEYVDSMRVMLPLDRYLRLILVGCGGTGSWLAPAVARIGKLLQDGYQKKVEILFFDPDTVEEKNIFRQNFFFAEIGKNKAEALATRYAMAWGLNIQYFEREFSWEKKLGEDFSGNELTIIIGCVDNSRARLSIDKLGTNRVLKDFWWLDCGNEKNTGQVVFGKLVKDSTQNKNTQMGIVTSLPSPSSVHPELIEPVLFDSSDSQEENLSCAEMALQNSQGLSINQRVAAEAADYLVRAVITRDLRKYATYIDLESGSTQSLYITKKFIKECGQ